MAERLSVLLLSGSFDRAHYALSIASTAAALERPATLFVTLAGTRALLAADEEGRPGWAGRGCTWRSARASSRSTPRNGCQNPNLGRNFVTCITGPALQTCLKSSLFGRRAG